MGLLGIVTAFFSLVEELAPFQAHSTLGTLYSVVPYLIDILFIRDGSWGRMGLLELLLAQILGSVHGLCDVVAGLVGVSLLENRDQLYLFLSVVDVGLQSLSVLQFIARNIWGVEKKRRRRGLILDRRDDRKGSLVPQLRGVEQGLVAEARFGSCQIWVDCAEKIGLCR